MKCTKCKETIDYLIETCNIERKMHVLCKENSLRYRNVEYGKIYNTYWFCPKCKHVVTKNKHEMKDLLIGEK